MQWGDESKEINKSAEMSVLTEDEQLAKKDLDDTTRKRLEQRKSLFSWLRYILLWLIIGLLISQFVLQRNTVYGESMVPNLYNQDELLVEKISRFFGGISRGDIVTCKSYIGNNEKNSSLVKRVIGLPGEKIEIRAGHVYINDDLLQEDYLAPEIKTIVVSERFNSIVLAEDEYYLLGDNRSHSQDSRYFGPVKKADITGEVLLRFYPFDRFGVP